MLKGIALLGVTEKAGGHRNVAGCRSTPPGFSKGARKPMSTTLDRSENGCDHIDHARFERACTEEMDIEKIAPGMWEIQHNGSTKTVDLQQGVCSGPDYQYRNVICKHIIKAAIITFHTEGVESEIVAKVVNYAHENPCPTGNARICDGPIGPKLPCPSCVAATTLDEWTIWQRTAKRTGEHR